jgi:hypothetical protein
MRQMLWVDQLRQDIRYAFKVLTRDRGFSFVAALALALGIAATTSLITVVNAALLQGLPLADSDRVVAITMRDPRNRQLGMSYPDFDDWQRASRSFSGMTLMLPVAFSVSDENHLPEQFSGPFTSANLFKVIGQTPFLGRDFTPDDDRPGAAPVVILGYGMWKSRYGGDASMVGGPPEPGSDPGLPGGEPIEHQAPALVLVELQDAIDDVLPNDGAGSGGHGQRVRAAAGGTAARLDLLAPDGEVVQQLPFRRERVGVPVENRNHTVAIADG